LASPFKSKSRLEAENAVLRHELIILQCKRPVGHRSCTAIVGFLFTCTGGSVDPAGSHDHPSRDAGALASSGLSLLLASVIAPTGRRPQIEVELRSPIRRMSIDNPLWGARIHGELLKLGFEVAQSSVGKYMVKRRGPPARDGVPSCTIMPQISPPWTYSSSRPLASICSMPSSSSG
jgi:hypothetical protein